MSSKSNIKNNSKIDNKILLIISPAKSFSSKDPLPTKEFSQPIFKKETLELIKELRKLSEKDISKLMSVSDKISKLNFDRFKDFQDNDLNKYEDLIKLGFRQALFYFDGDVYKNLDKRTFDENDLEFAQNNLIILSGLYGIIKPLDMIQEYRLEMGTNLKVGKNKNLYEFWSKKITSKLNEINKEYIINLVSEEYFSVISKLEAKIINCIFKKKVKDQYKIIGVEAKRARGLMAQFIIKNKISEIEELKNFEINGWKFSKELSKNNNLVFVK